MTDEEAREVARFQRRQEIRQLPPDQQLEFNQGRLSAYAHFIRNVMGLGLTDAQLTELLAFKADTITPIPDRRSALTQEGERVGKEEIKREVESVLNAKRPRR